MKIIDARSKPQGMTLIEVLVVVAIGVLRKEQRRNDLDEPVSGPIERRIG